MNKPEWCPHADCIVLTQYEQPICCGRLPNAIQHDNDKNTHRICLNGAGENGGVFDLQVNRSDTYWFGLLLKVVREDCDMIEYFKEMKQQGDTDGANHNM